MEERRKKERREKERREKEREKRRGERSVVYLSVVELDFLTHQLTHRTDNGSHRTAVCAYGGDE